MPLHCRLVFLPTVAEMCRLLSREPNAEAGLARRQVIIFKVLKRSRFGFANTHTASSVKYMLTMHTHELHKSKIEAFLLFRFFNKQRTVNWDISHCQISFLLSPHFNELVFSPLLQAGEVDKEGELCLFSLHRF